MNRQRILYLCIADELSLYSNAVKSSIIKNLKLNFEIDILESPSSTQETNNSSQVKFKHYDLVFVQNSQALLQYKSLLRSRKKIPLIFVSESDDILGHIAPIANVSGVFKFCDVNLKSWGIPDEIQTCLKIPVKKKQLQISGY
jgi:hypothetical protein